MNIFAQYSISLFIILTANLAFAGDATSIGENSESRAQGESIHTCPSLNFLNYDKAQQLGLPRNAETNLKIKLNAIALYNSLSDGKDGFCIDPETFNRNLSDLEKMNQVLPSAFKNFRFQYDMGRANRDLRIELTPEMGKALIAEIDSSAFKIPTEERLGVSVKKSTFELDGSVAFTTLDPKLRTELARFGFDLSNAEISVGSHPRAVSSITVRTASEDLIDTRKVAKHLRNQKYSGIEQFEKRSSIYAGYLPIFPACRGCGPTPIYRVVNPETSNHHYVIQNNGTHYFEVSNHGATLHHNPDLQTTEQLTQWYPKSVAENIQEQREVQKKYTPSN